MFLSGNIQLKADTRKAKYHKLTGALSWRTEAKKCEYVSHRLVRMAERSKALRSGRSLLL